MVSWVIVAIVIGAFLIYAKATNFRYSKAVSWTITIVLGFFTLSFIWVVMAAGLSDSLGTYDGFIGGIRVYALWLSTLFSTSASITGHAIEQLAQNVTNVTGP